MFLKNIFEMSLGRDISIKETNESKIESLHEFIEQDKKRTQK